MQKKQADILYDRGFWNEYLDSKGNPVFSMATCTEFALNGYKDVIIEPGEPMPENVYKYDLSRLVPRDIYQAYTEQRLSYQKEMHWSVLWSDGSVDTGQKLDGKSKKGFNMLYEFNLQYVYTYISDGERKDSTYKPDATSDSFNIPFPPTGSKRP